MPSNHVDWENLRYLHRHGASLKGLAHAFDLPASTVQERAQREGWRIRKVPLAVTLNDKSIPTLLAEADHSLAIALNRFASHVSRMDTRFLTKHANHIKILIELRDRLNGHNESQVARKNGKQRATGSPSYFAADADELRAITTAANSSGPDTESGEPSRESLND